MNKRQFIQTCTANSLPWLLSEDKPKFSKVVEYAELAWQRLCERGHGGTKGVPQEKGKDWYELIQGEARKQFDAFWNAFAFKHGKQDAAMTWYEMGDIPMEQAKQIIAAAKETAKNRDPKRAIWAQGWLNKRRWEDHTPAKEKKETKQIDSIQAQIKNLRILARCDTSGEIQQQIAELENN